MRMNRHLLRVFCGFSLFLLATPSFAWDEARFAQKKTTAYPYMLSDGKGAEQIKTVIGSPRTYTVQAKDTLLDIARYFDLGFNEIRDAHPQLDPWLPQVGREISLPTFWVLPKSRSTGGNGVHPNLVVNIPEMRMYYFPAQVKHGAGRVVLTYPVGLGREDWPTPQTPFRIRGKTANPTWVIPESIREERVKDKGWSETSLPGGSPDNPLGKYRLELSLSQASGAYAIHGTNNPWAVGRMVTHGCIRLYPEDIERFFDLVQVGSPGELTYQPVKIGMQNGRVYVEAHADIYGLVADPWGDAQRVVQDSGWAHLVDLALLLRALREQSGVPVDVTAKGVALCAPEEACGHKTGES
jgi:L,D-transpeptidase ErfK/SrfK